MSNFLNGRSFTLPDLMGFTPEDVQFFRLEVDQWKTSIVFRRLDQFVTGLLVINDPAERFIKTLKDWLGSVRSDDRLVNTLLTVEELRRLEENFKRHTITKADLKKVLYLFNLRPI